MRTRFCVLVGLCLVMVACSGGQDRDDAVGKGALTGPGVSGTEIRLGVLTDESGPRKALGLLRVRAARVFFQALNDVGGINGRRVHLVFGDHQSSPEIAAEKYLEMRESVLMFEQIFPVAFFKDELARDGMLASPVARYSTLAGDRHLVMTGTPYRVEMSNAVDWLAGTLNNEVRNNDIYDHESFGVFISESIHPDSIPMNNTVMDNKIRRSNIDGDEFGWDLAWTGDGADNCFSGNNFKGETGPPEIETIYACANRPFAGVPFGPVSAHVASFGPTSATRDQEEPPEPKRPRCQRGAPGCDLGKKTRPSRRG